MTALWRQYQQAKDTFHAAIGIRADGTPETAAAFDRAQRAIMDALAALGGKQFTLDCNRRPDCRVL